MRLMLPVAETMTIAQECMVTVATQQPMASQLQQSYVRSDWGYSITRPESRTCNQSRYEFWYSSILLLIVLALNLRTERT